MIRNMDDRVGYHIGIVAHFLQNSYNLVLAEYELTIAQAKVLYMLVKFGDQLQLELQNRLYIKSSTMNGIIESMIKKQLINKKDNDSDRRSKIISLTEKGRVLEARLWLGTKDMDAVLLKGFTEAEKQLLLSSLKRIKHNLLENKEGNEHATKISK
jgi:DNA-binding MarR family transcriptional regulator